MSEKEDIEQLRIIYSASLKSERIDRVPARFFTLGYVSGPVSCPELTTLGLELIL